MADPTPSIQAYAQGTETRQVSAEFFTTQQRSEQKKVAEKALAKTKKALKRAQTDAAGELAAKTRCIQHEQWVRTTQVSKVPIQLAVRTPLGKPQTQSAFRPGDSVLVEGDLSPGKNSHGGKAWVTQTNGHTADVTYFIGNSIERSVPFSRLTVIPSPIHTAQLQGGTPSLRERLPSPTAVNTPSPTKPAAHTTIDIILKMACSKGKGEGWRKRELLGSNKVKRGSEEAKRLKELIVADYRELQVFIQRDKAHLHNIRSKSQKFKQRKNKHNPLSVTYLAFAWGVNKNAPKEYYDASKTGQTRGNSRAIAAQQSAGRKDPPVRQKGNVIDNRECAKRIYNAERMYVLAFLKEHIAKGMNIRGGCSGKERLVKRARRNWRKLGKGVKDLWAAKAREHDEMQPSIKDAIITSLQRNPTLSMEKLSSEIGGWCSASTIGQWLKSKETYATYNERVLPLLSTEQKAKQKAFGLHLANRWGLPKKKYLWIHYDEKWFWGFVGRSNAKKCEELGLLRKYYHAYHKSHINKVMVLAVTGYAFDGDIENGGDSLKIALLRIQSARVAQKTVREGVRGEDGRIRYNGAILRRKGDVYMVDTNVTGSDEGTSKEPKFSLLAVFKDVLFPRVMELVGPGGPYEGYAPVFQGDNAGPHQDATFYQYMVDFCNGKGWHWEPQAAQMPYCNNLDLCVFPMMSKRHTDVLREYSSGVAPPDRIWEAAHSVWRDLEASEIAKGFVLAKRVGDKIAKNGGSNEFLGKGNFHLGVRDDFAATPKGIKRAVVN